MILENLYLIVAITEKTNAIGKDNNLLYYPEVAPVTIFLCGSLPAIVSSTDVSGLPTPVTLIAAYT